MLESLAPVQPGLSERLAGIGMAASAATTDLARDLAASGIKIIALSSGEPDFPTPENAIDAGFAAARAGDTKYPAQSGNLALKQAVQRKFRRENGLDYALDEILISNGGKQVIFNALMATCNGGDEVVIPSPYWISYADMARVAGAMPVLVPCAASDGFRPRPDLIEAAITKRTKWLLLNFPNNPTGAVCSPSDLQAIAEVMLRHPHVWILTDDMYEHLVFDDRVFRTVAEVEPLLRDRVLTVNGASKAYAMTGWRVGYCGGPRRLISTMVNMQGHSTSGVSSVGQAAAAAALDGSQNLLAARRAIYQERRDMVVAALNAAPGVSCHLPEGAFYAFPNITACLGRTTRAGVKLDTDIDFAAALLREQHVGVVQGAAYGLPGYLRISFAADTEILREGCARIQEFCRALT
jgi:aspartate aminotransferase